MQFLAPLLSLHIITGYVVGSGLLETGLFPHRLLNTQLKKVSVIITGSSIATTCWPSGEKHRGFLLSPFDQGALS